MDAEERGLFPAAKARRGKAATKGARNSFRFGLVAALEVGSSFQR
jgi:hypothetical protein